MPQAALMAALLPLTLAVAVVDLRRQIIPDVLNLALLGMGLCLAAADAEGEVMAAVGLAAAQAGLAYVLFGALRAAYARRRGRSGLGLGDVKFAAAAASIIGLAGLPVMILVASLSALAAVGLAAVSGRAIGAGTRIPFGPFLALGLHAAALMGPQAA